MICVFVTASEVRAAAGTMVSHTEPPSSCTPQLSTSGVFWVAPRWSSVVRRVSRTVARRRRQRRRRRRTASTGSRCRHGVPAVSYARRRAAVDPPGRQPSTVPPRSPSMRPSPRRSTAARYWYVSPAAENAADVEKADCWVVKGASDVHGSQPDWQTVASRLSVFVHNLQRRLLVFLLNSMIALRRSQGFRVVEVVRSSIHI